MAKKEDLYKQSYWMEVETPNTRLEVKIINC